jgi:NAD(P) transhydrogenase subunit beta
MMREALARPVIGAAYLVASLLFILCLRGLGSPESARRGLVLGEVGMLLAVVGTLLHWQIVSYGLIFGGMALGAAIGTAISLTIPMARMPERIALSHAFGGLASALVGVSEYHAQAGAFTDERFKMGALGVETFLGFLTFTGSLMAFGKLAALVPGRPLTFRGQNYLNLGLFAAAMGVLVYLIAGPVAAPLFYGLAAAGLALGVLAVAPIGGADMPVVISLLNSYAGLAACATGFAIDSKVLIICGALDGSSGLLLSIVMSRAMNRSFGNVLFGAFGTEIDAPALLPGAAARPFNEATVEDAAAVLRAAQTVIVVPGYGMAVSQAQHAVRDLVTALEARGATVKYAIHPVAGRMPGHMNVLLAEANVPYDQLYDLDAINDEFPRTDAVLVVGANDVVNPAAKKDPKSAIYGMAVFDADLSRSVLVLKRSMNAGFAGVENELFFAPNTMMVLGDAKETLLGLLAAVKER